MQKNKGEFDMRKLFFIGYIIVLAMMFVSCTNKTTMESFQREDVDFSFVERIAVLPFQNNSSDKFASKRTRDVTITQVLSLGIFDVVEKDLVDSVLYEEAIDPGSAIDPLTLKRMGNRLNVQGFLLGTIDLAGMGKVGSATYPELAVTLRLVEAESGMILWQASGSLSGESLANRLLGTKGDDTYQITAKLIKLLLRTAPNY